MDQKCGRKTVLKKIASLFMMILNLNLNYRDPDHNSGPDSNYQIYRIYIAKI